MPRVALKDRTTEELQSMVSNARNVLVLIIGVFLVLMALWFVFGSWRSNMPVLLITFVMGVAISIANFTMYKGLEAELRKRQDA
jgi:uncharacterized protein (DUF983 family)